MAGILTAPVVLPHIPALCLKMAPAAERWTIKEKMRMLRLLFVAWLCCLVGLGALAAPPGAFSDELDARAYDCTVSLQPTRPGGAATVLLEWAGERNGVSVVVGPRQITVHHLAGDVDTLAGTGELPPAGRSLVLTVMRRGEQLLVQHEGAILFQCACPRGGGAEGGVTAEGGWTVQDVQVQRLEPVAFSDNFMRTADEPGPWRVQSGQWRLQAAWERGDAHGVSDFFGASSYAQNPFAWAGRSDGGSALCTAGTPAWEDYTFTAAVFPGEHGAIGLMANVADPQHGILVRWTPANDPGTEGNRLALYAIRAGQRTLLAEDAGGYVPGTWYAMTLVSDTDGVRVLVDGRERLAARHVTPWRGGVGLYAEGQDGMVFDDVTVYGHALNTDLIEENAIIRVNERFRTDQYMREWADSSFDWIYKNTFPPYRVHRWDFYGDHWLTLTVTPGALNTGELWMSLNGDGQTATSGYRAVIRQANDTLTCTLLCNDQQLATRTAAPLALNEPVCFRLKRVGARLVLEQDGTPVVEATDLPPAPGRRPAYRATGSLARVRDVAALGHHALDYTFANAPVDWVDGGGLWMPTHRWACSPEWSFLGGWGRGETVLWHKQRFTGDQSLQAFIGIKMEYPRERMIFDYRYRDLALTICGDGQDPRTGYTGIYGAPGVGGAPNERTLILRNGQVVASIYRPMPPRSAEIYRDWFDIALRKTGSRVEFLISGQVVLTYDDPAPIDGGVPGIWSVDNGITLARVRMHFANLPETRTDPRVVLDRPWYPEWADVGTPLALQFSRAWATTGRPVALHVTPRQVPAGEQALPVVEGTRVTWTPGAAGEHWYQITATDGANTSPGYPLALPVFDPARGRDDSHALVLYRFDEGQGGVVHDRGAVAPAADLKLLPDAPVTWLPGRGLHLDRATMLKTAGGVPKLMKMATQRAGTIELWVSNDTKYPPADTNYGIRFIGTQISWGNAENGRANFAMGNQWEVFLFAPKGTRLAAQNNGAFEAPRGYRLGLQHMVITWDGATTRYYVNGELWQTMTDGNLPWRTAQWEADLPLILGNQASMERQYLGTYYLVAIHDACLSAEQIRRHYLAGPDAR